MRAPWASVLCVSMLLCGRTVEARSGSSIAVLHAWGDEFGAATARHLGDQLEDLEILKTSTGALALSVLVPRAAVDWPGGLVVALNTADHQVVVIRPADGTVLSRVLDPQRRTSPYAVAVAALELLDLAGEDVGLGRVGTSSAAGTQLSFAFEVGGVLSSAPEGEGSFPMVSAAVWLVLRGPNSPWWGGVGLEARGLGEKEASFAPYSIDYDRLDFGLKLGLGRRDGRFETLLAAELGASFVQIAASDENGTIAGQDQRFSPWAGGSLEGRLLLGAGFGLKASVGLAIVLNRARFLVLGDPAFEEGAIRLLFGLGVLWASSE